MKGIISGLEKLIEPFKDFIMKHHSNPILWLIVLGIGIFVFKTVYSALQKEK